MGEKMAQTGKGSRQCKADPPMRVACREEWKEIQAKGKDESNGKMVREALWPEEGIDRHELKFKLNLL